jgi:putative ATP-binding cassette transporter
VKILTLFRRELAASWPRFLLLGALSGISNAAVLATINSAANSLHDRDAMARALVVLAIAIIVYIISQKALMISAATLAENMVNHLRMSFFEKLSSADLIEVEGLNRNEIYTCISGEMQVMADGTLTLTIIGQSLALVLVTMLYLAWLSLAALALAVIFCAIAIYIHIARSQQLQDQLQETFQRETRLTERFTDFVEGFKEIKLNTNRSREFANRVRNLLAEVTEKRLTTRSLFATAFVASQVTFFLLTGIMVFVVPLMSKVKPETVVMMTTAVLFLIGPISSVVGGLPILQRVNSAADAILSLEGRLSQISQVAAAAEVGFTHFDQITLNAAAFRYASAEGEAGFQVGPIDMDIRRGQIAFITGGNGSGKSTLLKLITGLYLPTSGVVNLDGQAILPDNIVAYRNLFSAIFSDYHLFKELYGLPEVTQDRATELFRLLEMEHKAHIVEQAFDTIALSSGQRKRLALITLLLEDRPICVFDEWAADQDPHFREKFYREILPHLRQSGKTIIAITHDDRYFDVADFRVHLEEGRLQFITSQAAPARDA